MNNEILIRFLVEWSQLLLSIMLNFSPKIRLGNLMNVMVIKKGSIHLFCHNIDAWSLFVISKCKYATLCAVVERMVQGVGP